MRLNMAVPGRRPPCSWGGMGVLVALGSVTTMVVLIIVDSSISAVTETLGAVGGRVGMFAATFQIFAIWLVPVLIFNCVMRWAVKRYVSTDRDTRLASIVACIVYGLLSPFVLLLLMLITTMMRGG